MSRIRITIDRLAVNGLESAAAQALAAALQRELTRVFATPAARAEWARSHRTPALRLGQMPLEAGTAGGGKMGGNLARAIGREIKQ